MFNSIQNRALAIALALNIALPAFPQGAAKTPPAKPQARPHRSEPTALTENQRALHALNRLTFGPRPGDLQAVLAKGIDAWIEDELHPESVDDSALNARVGPYATTRMSPKQLAQAFPSDGVIRQIIAGKRPMPDDPELKFVYGVNIARIHQQEAAKVVAASANASTASAATATNGADPKAESKADPKPDAEVKPASPEDAARAIADNLLALPKNQRLAAMEAAPVEQMINFPNLLRGDQRDRLSADFSPHEREVFRSLSNPQGTVV